MTTVKTIFLRYPAVNVVWLFGSRAKGNYKPGSDLDLVIINTGVEDKLLRAIQADFEESSLPYHVDILKLEAITNPDLYNHIMKVGIEVYNTESR